MAIPARIQDRIVTTLKKMVPIVIQQKARDVSEADTVTLVKDLLSAAFGYDKYTELTSEFAIRSTYCDLAIKVDDKLVKLVEVKAVGIALDDRHVKQAIDYAANQGVEWVILTNALQWRLYQVIFGKPIDKRLLVEIDLASVDLKNDDCLDILYLFTKEGFKKGAHIDIRDRQDASSRFMLAALLLNNTSILAAIRRELRRIVDVLVDDKVILNVLHNEVIKRDAIEGPSAEDASKRVNRAEKKASGIPSTPRPKTATESDSPAAEVIVNPDDTIAASDAPDQ